MTRAREPQPREIRAARHDPRLLRASRERPVDPGWRSESQCRTADPDTFFPSSTGRARSALAVCRRCEVQGACLAAALDAEDANGVWGATTPRERRAMLVVWRNRRHQTRDSSLPANPPSSDVPPGPGAIAIS